MDRCIERERYIYIYIICIGLNLFLLRTGLLMMRGGASMLSYDQ